MNVNTVADANPYRSLLIEVRPRLQSVNVFVNLNRGYENLRVVLYADYFEIEFGNATYKIDCPDFEIVLNSLSNVQKEIDYLYFRFSTNSANNFGSFKSELLQLDNVVTSAVTEKTFLEKTESYSIKCKNCLQAFCRDIAFIRILPLPSDTANHNDWFCHAHEGEPPTLDPRPKDIFYTHCYVHVNKSLLSGIITSNTNIACKRCLQWVGLIVNENTRKIWFSTANFVSSSKIFTSDPLEDALKTIADSTQENLVASSKLVLYCQVSSTEVNYLMVWVMERKLAIYVHDENGKRNSDMAKVLFKFEPIEDEVVKQWKQNFGVPHVSISKNMMSALVKYLYEMNSYVPKIFSTTNNFYISYLSMYNFIK